MDCKSIVEIYLKNIVTTVFLINIIGRYYLSFAMKAKRPQLYSM